MPNAELSAVDRLGYAIDASRITTMDISSVNSSVLTLRRIINIDVDDTRPVVIGGVTYDVPTAVAIVDDNTTSQGAFSTYPSGTQASAAFEKDPTLGTHYFALSGSTSATYAAEKSFIRGSQYGFYAFTRNIYRAQLRDYVDYLNESALEKGVQDLTKPFNGVNPNILKQYKDFFERYGSHVIVNANYGARYPMKAWASNQTAAVNNRFAASLKAMFSGIPSGGSFEASVMQEAQYKQFEGYLQYIVTVSGGDRALAVKLGNVSASYPEYTSWTNSATQTQSAALLSFQVTELWTLMKQAASAKLRDYADPLYDAFMYIITHPLPYKTAVTLDIQTDWAEFNLLTPGNVIIPDPAYPYPTNTVASDTRVQWGREYSHNYERKTLRFFVVNDGSPVDFSISHGSLASGGGWGRAEARMEGQTYLNAVVTDNVRNAKWFYGAPVAKDPAPASLSQKYAARSWDEVLYQYLKEIGMSS